MLFLKNCGKSVLYNLGSLMILTVLLTIINYFNLFNSSITNILKIVNMVLSILIGSFLLGKKSINKGWLEGIKYGLVISIILFAFNYLALDRFNIIIYPIVLVTSMVGAVIGINYKKS